MAAELVSAWRRGESIEGRRSLWFATASTLAILTLVPSVVGPFIASLLGVTWNPATGAPISPPHTPWLINAVIVGGLFAAFPASGWISGMMFPRRGAVGATLGSLAFIAVISVRFPYSATATDFSVTAVIFAMVTLSSIMGVLLRKRRDGKLLSANA